MSNELRIVREIEKHQCLYNFHLAEYSRKHVTDQAWADVAATVELSGKGHEPIILFLLIST